MTLRITARHWTARSTATLATGLCLVVACSLSTALAKPVAPVAGPAPKAGCPAVLQHTAPRLQDERPINLCDYAGQVVLVVNTASQCGYTPQYKSLEALNARFQGRGFVVLGFPSNDFGQQEPGGNAAIAEFCENQFAVRFPMFAKTVVRASARTPAHPLFDGLARRTGQAPQWNFHKYLIGRSGEVVTSHVSEVDPQDPALVRAIEGLLASR